MYSVPGFLRRSLQNFFQFGAFVWISRSYFRLVSPINPSTRLTFSSHCRRYCLLWNSKVETTAAAFAPTHFNIFEPSSNLIKIFFSCSSTSTGQIWITLPSLINMGKTKGNFYAVARGREVGIYQTWDECKAQVDGFPNARYKKFPSADEANAFISEHRTPNPSAKAGLKLSGSSRSSATAASVTTFQNIPSSISHTSGLPKVGSSILPHSRAFLQPNFVMPSSAATGVRGTSQKRDLSSLKVTEDRIVNKRAKIEHPNSKVDLKSFTVDDDGYVVVFTDGACTKNGRSAAKAGIGVYFGDNHPLNVSEPVDGRQTNNTAEIQAAERAISAAKLNGINKLNVRTDSQFTINCVTKWLYNWKRKDWKLSNGGDVKNKEDLIKLDSVMQGMEIKWSYVAGHKGIAGNEAADRLAVAGAERAK